MSVEENLDLVRRGYAAFSAGDMDTLRESFAPDVVQIIPGSSPLSGTHKGVDAVLALYGKLFELSDGTMRVELEDLWSDGGDRVAALHRASAQRNGKTMDVREVLLFTLADGKVTEIQDFVADIGENDAFWS